MKQCWLLLLVCACACGAPTDSAKPGSCEDPSVLEATEEALTRINQDREQGYVFGLRRLSNVNQMQHGPTGMVYYLTLDVLETKCHVLSKKNGSSCEVRQTHDTPVYGQCKATIYINKAQGVVRLYTYSCSLRPAPSYKIHRLCPDCPAQVPLDSENILKTVKMALEKYNSESGHSNSFALLNITRASSQGGFGMFYFAEFTIQETVCANTTDLAEVSNCKLMTCEFAHKGLCKGSYTQAQGNEYINVDCDIFEPEGAEEEKQKHLLRGEHGHTDGTAETHEHQHLHLHSYEHHHDQDHTRSQDQKALSKQPRGEVCYLPAVERPPPQPDKPEPIPSDPGHPITLPVFPDTEEKGPVILPFPSTISTQCPSQPKSEQPFITELFEQDPLFHHAIDIVG